MNNNKNTITIVDYGLGNIRSFVNLYKKLNIEIFNTNFSFF